ncbi:hypothetical protein L5D93_03985 [Paenibacillus thiaminolyticus]|nr:hypothetical protein [Paenibacillus thiaminolyticus]
MVDVERLAGVFANDPYNIEDVYRLVIQPKSILREFRTVRHGFLFTVRGQARICVNGTVYDLHPGFVFHAAPGMQLDSRVIGQSELEYYSVFYRLDMSGEDNRDHECNTHFKLEPGANPSDRITDYASSECSNTWRDWETSREGIIFKYPASSAGGPQASDDQPRSK